jgi:hypothetical protein
MNIFALEYAVLGILLLVSGRNFPRAITTWIRRLRSSGTNKTGLKLLL